MACSGSRPPANPAPSGIPVAESSHEPIVLAAGESIQAAIDRAPENSVVRLPEGAWNERIVIEKPLTLEGSGWERTRIAVEEPPPDALGEGLLRTLQEGEKTDEERRKVAREWVARVARPAVWVRDCRGVTLRGIRVQGTSQRGRDEGIAPMTLVYFQRAHVSMSACAVVGPYSQGIQIADGSDVEIRTCLVAGIWGTGVAVAGRDASTSQEESRLHLLESEIRNCYHRCVTIGSDGVVVERCRISGSAWHGIRYDGVGPTIRDNAIFGNARCGIYASGRTNATVRGNLFWKNEMDGVSCWFENRDTIEGNTFVGNLREGILVVAGARPTLSKNIFAAQPIAIACSTTQTRSGGVSAVGDPALARNLFWDNATILRSGNADQPVPADGVLADPGFRDGTKQDFAFAETSPARAQGLGAAEPLPPIGLWPLQEEERSIIPASDTRDSKQWTATGRAKTPARDP